MSDIDTQVALIAEVERLRLVNKRLHRRAQSAEAAADTNAGDWNKRAAGAQLRNHYYVRAEAAEAENARLAVRLAESHEVIVTLKECADAANRRAEAAEVEHAELRAENERVWTNQREHYGRACAAEARVTLLEDAIREWTEAVDELERRDGPRVMRGNVRERKAEATLRAFVGLIPPRPRKTSNP